MVSSTFKIPLFLKIYGGYVVGKVFKPIYVCDKCETQFEDPLQLRSFLGPVSDGETDNYFIIVDDNTEPKMYCLKCIPEVLELSNYVPNITFKSKLEKDIKKFSEEIRYKVEESSSEQNLDIVEFDENIFDEQPKETVQEEKTIQETVQPIVSDAYMEIENNNFLEDGEFLVLYKIINEEQEDHLAQQYGYKNADEFRNMYGGSLIGLYISTNSYTNDLPKGGFIDKIKLINKVVFGIPNVETKDCYMIKNDKLGLAYIDKNDFILQIESIDIKVPEDPNIFDEELEESEEVEEVSDKKNSYFESKFGKKLEDDFEEKFGGDYI
jgi:hypothetical protein